MEINNLVVPHAPYLNGHGQVKTLEQSNKEHIEGVFRYYHGNVTRTCRALGIGRTTLYRKLKAYGVRK